MPGKYRIIIGISLIVLGFSCSMHYDSAEELRTYVTDQSNGLVSSKEANGITIKVLHQPSDLLIERELKSGRRSLEQLQAKYEPNVYFLLSYSKEGRGILRTGTYGQADYSAKLNELSYRMGRHVRLIAGRDTIPVKDYAYQNMFGAARSTDVLFAFDKSKVMGADQLEFVLSDIGFGVGKQVFEFDAEKIWNAPGLRLEAYHKQ